MHIPDSEMLKDFESRGLQYPKLFVLHATIEMIRRNNGRLRRMSYRGEIYVNTMDLICGHHCIETNASIALERFTSLYACKLDLSLRPIFSLMRSTDYLCRGYYFWATERLLSTDTANSIADVSSCSFPVYITRYIPLNRILELWTGGLRVAVTHDKRLRIVYLCLSS